MALATTLEKTRKDIEKILSDSGALNVVVGTADLAVKKFRDAQAELAARAAAIDPKALRDQAQATVVAAPAQVKALPTKAEAVFGEAFTTALTTYGDLAERGKGLVVRVRRQQATQDLKAQASTTASHAKATVTTAKKSAASTKTAAKSAATTAKKSAASTKSAAKSATTTAKKSAARTKTSAKSTATSAKNTVAAAAQAAEDTASKIGE